jgi:midasin (ATPase involved in ribosome maturation)
LDEARPAGEDRKEEDPSQQPDIRSEEKAIEMSEDFEGKTHDLEDADREERSDGEDEGQEEELDKQMGDVDGDDREKLDDQMWGSDEEEGEDQGVSAERSRGECREVRGECREVNGLVERGQGVSAKRSRGECREVRVSTEVRRWD